MNKSNTKMNETKSRVTISLSKEAKRILDQYGKKNENYSEIVKRMACCCNFAPVNANEPKEVKKVEQPSS